MRRWSPAWRTPSPPPASRCSGRRKEAAQLEGSKGFTKELCRRHNIPTAAYERFTELRQGRGLHQEAGRADRGEGRRPRRRQGRDRGRDRRAGASTAARDMLAGNRFGASGASVVIEEFMDGEEVSLFALSRRRACAAAGRRAGPQARLRRRQGARTPAAWAPIRRCRSSTRRCSTARCARSSCRRSRR